jgi:hypothetical protein
MYITKGNSPILIHNIVPAKKCYFVFSVEFDGQFKMQVIYIQYGKGTPY